MTTPTLREAAQAVVDADDAHCLDQRRIDALRAALAAPAGMPTEPVAGWRLVPEAPTDDMFIEGMTADCSGRPSVDDETHVRSIWAAMLNAAPPPPKGQP